MTIQSFSNRTVRLAGTLLAAVLLAGTMAVSAFAQETDSRIVVEYQNLSTLLQQGNLDLKKTLDNYETSKSDYQELLNTLEDEQDYMKFLKEKYEDDTEASGVYASNAAMLASSASQIRSRLERLDSRSNLRTLASAVDSHTLAAQTQMNSYNQMVKNVAAQEKTVQAAQAAYQAVVTKQAAGAATAAEVLASADQLAQAQNSCTSYQNQAAQLRASLLSTLGITDSDAVEIGTIPEPDLAAINAIDFEADRQKALTNNSSVQSARKASVDTPWEVEQRARLETEAEATSDADITASYQTLKATQTAYQAAEESYESASLIYQSLQRKKQAGTVGTAACLEGEAAYLKAEAARATASMNLYQAYETYCWDVKGVS